MKLTYVQRTGRLRDETGIVLWTCYSGNGPDMNNPASQGLVGRGPLPCGTYRVGPPHEPVDHLGRLAMPLVPLDERKMEGRSGFFLHGDNSRMNHTASNGCIIAGPSARQAVANAVHRGMVNPGQEVELLVVAEEADLAPPPV